MKRKYQVHVAHHALPIEGTLIVTTSEDRYDVDRALHRELPGFDIGEITEV